MVGGHLAPETGDTPRPPPPQFTAWHLKSRLGPSRLFPAWAVCVCAASFPSLARRCCSREDRAQPWPGIGRPPPPLAPPVYPPSLGQPPTGVLSALNSFRWRPRPRLRLAVTWGPGWMSAGGSAPEAEERGLWVSALWPWPPRPPPPVPTPRPPPQRSWLLLRGSGCRLLRARARVRLPPRLSLPPVLPGSRRLAPLQCPGWACGVKAGGWVQGHVAGGGSPSQGLSHSGVRGPGWGVRVLPSADASVGTHVPTARVGCGAGGPPCWARWGPPAVGDQDGFSGLHG